MNVSFKTALCAALLSLWGAAHANLTSYQITTTWLEPDTQPKNTIFEGSFSFDASTLTITGLQGRLSESMTGKTAADMVWVNLSNQLLTWRDNTLGGSFAAVFKNSNTNTFSTANGGDGWSPQAGIDIGATYYGNPIKAQNPGNAYALIFVPDTPTAALTQNQINHLAYADCTPTAPGGMKAGGGMMGATCMTGTSDAVYTSVGTMSGYPVSQTITAAVPEPGSWALMLGGLTLLGSLVRRRRSEG